jgi:hypothetical protein
MILPFNRFSANRSAQFAISASGPTLVRAGWADNLKHLAGGSAMSKGIPI